MPIVKYKTNGNWVAIPTSGAIATDTTYGYEKIATAVDVAAGTDNSAAITAKQLKDYSDENFVHLTGNETIEGTKTFNTAISTNGVHMDGIQIVNGQEDFKDVIGVDTNNKRIGGLRFIHNSNNYREAGIYVCNTQNVNKSSIIIGIEDDDTTIYAKAPHPSTSSSTSDTNIATIGWVNNPDLSQNVVHQTGDEEITGIKTFTGTIVSTKKDSNVPNNFLAVKTAQSSGYSDLLGMYDTTNNCRVVTIRGTNSSTEHTLLLGANNFNDGSPQGIKISYDSSNNLTITTHTPSSVTNNSTEIATTEWVNSKIQFVNALPANPVNGVLYLIPES